MKILALRGENICSLQQKFEVDFTSEPLASAGLFAISGPTGAGKSTLLDVLCLALYHTTPRLEAAPQRDVSIPDAEDDKLSVSDAKNLLRKGAGSGFAEVDFQGVDKKLYRARWSVRRAGDKAQGKFQQTKASLHSIPDAQLISSSIKEVRVVSEKKIGLTFAEFTRSVLLAQNEFTSFLRGTDSEKAAILEKLTGVDIFSRIGSAIYKKRQAAEQEVKVIQASLSHMNLLSEEQVQAFETELSALNAQDQQYKDVIEVLAEDLRDAAELSNLTTEESKIISSLTENQQLESAAQDLCQTRQSELTQVQNHLQAQEPDLKKARELDAQLLSLKAECERALKQAHTKTEALRSAQGDQLTLESRIAGQRAIIQEIDDWKQGHAALRNWVIDWPELNQALHNAESAIKKQAENQSGLDRVNADIAQQEKSLAQAHTEMENAKAALDQADEQVKRLEEQLNKISLEGIEDQRMLVEKETQTLGRLCEIKKSTTGLKATHTEHQELLKQCKEKVEKCAAELEKGTLHCAQLEAERDRLMALKETIELKVSQSVKALRDALQDGEQCPVCGSLEHPFAHQDVENPLRELRQSVQNDLLAANDRLKNAIQTNTDLSVQKGSAESALSLHSQRLLALEHEIKTAESEWAHLSAVKIEESPELSQLEANLAQSRDHLKQINADLKQTSELQQQVQKQLRVRQTKSEALQKHSEQSQKIKSDLGVLQERQEQTERLLKSSIADFEAALQKLEGAAGDPGWKSRWLVNPAQQSERLRRYVELWQEKDVQSQASSQSLVELLAKEVALQQHIKMLIGAEQEALQFQNEQDLQLENLLARRSELLAGRSVADVEIELNQKIKSATDAWEKARTECHQHELKRVEWETLLKETKTKIETLSANVLRRGQRLSEMVQLLGDPVSISDRSLALDFFKNQSKSLEEKRGNIRASLEANQRLNDERGQAFVKLQESQSRFSRWDRLSDLIGCATGNRFRKEAQRYTLELLLAHANHHLQAIAPRYRLMTQSESLNILVEDLDSGGELRSVYSLSGGESFLISLALAMGLSTLSSEQVQVESLFIDEGFGSLDSDSLKVALDALDALQSQGRKVGVISHVSEMSERIGVQIRIQPQGQGRSRVVVPGQFG